MFIRKKANKSGVISVQIIDKSSGRYRMVKTVGSSDKPEEISSLLLQGREMISVLQRQGSFNFDITEERRLVDLFFKGIDEL